MKNVLITGGAGFVGSNLTLEVQKRFPEARITVLDCFRGAGFKNLIGYRGDFLAFEAADPAWTRVFEGKPIDVIFHLASITDTTVLDEKKMMYDNVEGFRTVLDLAVRKKADVVFASSAAVYGSQDEPMKESDGGRPNNIYGFSKWILEQLAREYASKIKVVGLRYFNVFGPRETFKGAAASMTYQLAQRMMAGQRPRIFKYGEQKRDFIYVKDVVEATIRARDCKESTVMNVGTGKATSFNELIDAVNEALGTRLETEYYDNPYSFYQNFTQADTTHARRASGFKCRYSTRQAVIEYVREYLQPAAAAGVS
jgi:ADP-L-glycero-D-manno-heptose 6-epimerase